MTMGSPQRNSTCFGSTPNHNSPETTADGSDRLRIYSKPQFINEVLGMAIQAKALIVCFNSGFDLSRLALDWETARDGRMVPDPLTMARS